MEMLWFFSVVIQFIALSIAAPLEKIEGTAIRHDDIKELSDGSPIYTDRGTVIIGDMEINLNRNAVLNPNQRWPNGQIFYQISPHYSTALHDIIIASMRELEHDINGAGNCIRFIPRTNQYNYINIHDGIGCHSVIGYDTLGSKEVSIGIGCEMKGTIMHELMHSLGFWHEQNRPDRDNYIDIDWSNVQSGSMQEYNIKTTSEVTTLHTTYDFSSIMHYGAYTFAADRSRPVMTPKPGLATPTTVMGQSLRLSETDVLKIQRLYGCREDTSHITRPTTYINCTFENTMCSMTTENTPTYTWTFNKGGSSAGPHAGNSYGKDTYLVVRESPTHSPGVASFHTATFNNGPVCVDFFLYQKGPSSYLQLVSKGPRLVPLVFNSYMNNNHDNWYHTRSTLNVPDGFDFAITFEAHMGAGDIAIDDLNIYEGFCV